MRPADSGASLRVVPVNRLPLWRVLLRELIAWWSAIVLPHLDSPLEEVPEMLWDRVPQATPGERRRVAALRLEERLA